MAPLTLPSILNPSPSTQRSTRQQPFILLQSSTSQTCLPILRSLISSTLALQMTKNKRKVVVFCLLNPPSSIVDSRGVSEEDLRILDWTERIPGYEDTQYDLQTEMFDVVTKATEEQRPVDVIIDSVDTLLSDIGSPSKVYNLLSKIFSLISKPSNSSRLILHILTPPGQPLIPLLTQTHFSPTLTHITSHPPMLITHISTSFLIPPPPISTPEKFWSVFLPLAGRSSEVEKLAFGTEGEGTGWGFGSSLGGGGREFVVEVLVRGSGVVEGRKRGVERVLEGWRVSDTSGGLDGAPCELGELASLKDLYVKKSTDSVVQATSDPTQNVSFNLHLTPEQERSRASVPLPYAHEGNPAPGTSVPSAGAILYDPDSADDIDDDDPDEDLDI